MIEALLDRSVVIGFAVAGAVLSMLASALRLRGAIGACTARALGAAGYGCMGASMLLFLAAGLRAGNA